MKQERGQERPGEKGDLPRDELDQRPTSRTGDAILGDARLSDVPEIVHELPLGEEKAVEEPDIELLQPMEAVARLDGRQAREEGDVDVFVRAAQVRVGVMKDVVLPLPDVGARAEQIEGDAH